MTPINYHGIIQKIRLKYNGTIDTIVAIMFRAIENPVSRKIILVLAGILIAVSLTYLITFFGFIQTPTQQGMNSLSILLVSYFLIAIAFAISAVWYSEKSFRASRTGKINKEIDVENLEKIQSLIIEDVKEFADKK
jgi:hypothetical protein